ncbi:colicin V synthesis protein [Rhodoblastus sphagnicola]|uniref:Colicin V synthesis protein n=1 Tax=Rhodoblastus sphagnicola TaxID=333368 RepID=A0A2S6N653_9HYPH|nr:CvpA family protein [Rhodoblastus sphagnicola]MBB4196354.1 membrane protein required for colicin V production [Rhodoblastus sphagnicola]PPQ30103.1 colicin V synthesis protein [Rhodoblastus sphagnicola]
MPSYLDLIVLAVIVISALLAMLRGFTREVMAILSWGAAAAAAIYLYPMLVPKLADPGSPIFVAKETLRPYLAGAGIFFVVLILVSIVTIRISDAILDSKIGALDRSLGFLFGLARGLLLCAIAFVFLNWLAPDAVNGTDKGTKKDWLANSKSLPLLKTASDQILALLPDDPDGLISKFKKAKPAATEEAPAPDADAEPKDAPATPSPAAPAKPEAKPQAKPDAKSDAGADKNKLDSLMRGGR